MAREARNLGIAQVTEDIEKYQVVCFDGSRLEMKSVKELSKALAGGQSVRELRIRNDDLCQNCTRYLSEDLADSRTLRLLDLSCNRMEYEEIRWLCRLLRVNKSIEDLDLSGNTVGYETLEALVDGLQVNTTLRSLNLDRTHLDDKAAKLLYRSLPTMRLRSISIVGNDINPRLLSLLRGKLS